MVLANCRTSINDLKIELRGVLINRILSGVLQVYEGKIRRAVERLVRGGCYNRWDAIMLADLNQFKSKLLTKFFSK